AKSRTQLGIVQEIDQCSCQRTGVTGRDQKTVLTVAAVLLEAPARGKNHRAAERHRLESSVTESLPARREGDDVCSRQDRKEMLRAQVPKEMHPLYRGPRNPPKTLAHRAAATGRVVPGKHEMRVGEPLPYLAHRLDEHVHALSRLEPARECDHRSAGG